MKKRLFLRLIILATTALVITSCQKSITESNQEASKAIPDAALKNQCRLTRFTYPGFDNFFHYNDKGLADEWRIEYGSGPADVYSMSYDENNKLTRAWWHFDGNLLATIDFVWTGNLITLEHWDIEGFPMDITNTYDRKGQMIKRETSYGLGGTVQYSPIGNATVLDIAFDGEIFQKHEMTHNVPNRNPFLAIHGIPYGFPFVVIPFSKWWETSEKITVYSDGVPTVVMDPDPSQTTLDFGFQNYLQQANYFDLATNSPLVVPFEYENCGPNNNESPTRIMPNIHSAGKTKAIAPLRIGNPDFIQDQITKMRNHNR